MPKSPPVTTTQPESVIDRFDALQTALQAELVERDEEIHGMLVALVSQLHILFLGAPGLAKSLLVDRTFGRISGISYGKWPLHRLMAVDDLFGPVDVAGYAEQGRFRRLLPGYLGAVEYANLEEIFKASASTLGMLLSSLNERRIRNDGAMIDIPLRMIACSSNELPKDEITAPLYDRIALRYEVLAPQDKASVQRMLELPRLSTDLEPILTAEDLAKAQSEAASLPFSPSVSVKLTELYFALLERGIRPTPRRLDWTRRAAQAEAWLDGSDIVATDHLSIAAAVLWDSPAQRADVADCVLEMANPMEKRTIKLLEGVAEIRKMLPAAVACTDEEQQRALGLEAYHKISEAGDELRNLVNEGGTGRRQRELLRSAKASVHEVLLTMVRDVMHLPEEEIAAFGVAGLDEVSP